jgi:hypothetical protein
MTLALIVDADTVSDQLSGTSTTTGAFIRSPSVDTDVRSDSAYGGNTLAEISV